MFLEFVLEQCYWFAIVAVYISSHITALALVTDGWHSLAEILRYSTSVDQLACNQMALSSIPAFLSTLSTFVQLQLSSCQHSRLTLLYCFSSTWMGSKGEGEGLNCPYLEDLTPCLVDQKSSRWQITESFACQLVCRLALQQAEAANLDSFHFQSSCSLLTSPSLCARDGGGCQEDLLLLVQLDLHVHDIFSSESIISRCTIQLIQCQLNSGISGFRKQIDFSRKKQWEFLGLPFISNFFVLGMYWWL